MAVIIPVRPRVATNANASGTPAKFDATPENVISMERSGLGSPPIVATNRGDRANANAQPIGIKNTFLLKQLEYVTYGEAPLIICKTAHE